MTEPKAKKEPKQEKATESYDYDTIIIGTGPGGEGAAMNLAKQDKKVAIIERHSSVGGGCTHWGTIPSKALRYSVLRFIEFKNTPLFSQAAQTLQPTFPDILKHASGVIRKQINLRTTFYNRNNVTLIHGEGSFIDQHTVAIAGEDGAVETITAQTIVIATGSRPYHPPEVDFSHPRVYDSDKILSLNHSPRSIIIYGAGVIGCEYASIFKGLGVKVDLINTRGRLLEFLDNEFSDALSYHLNSGKTTIRHGEEFKSVEAQDDCVILHTQSGKKIKADCILWANGRTGNTDKLNLESIGLKADRRGQVSVNSNYQTKIENVYAVGDVIGYPSLASAAFDQGRITANAILNGDADSALIEDIPTGIYTIPEISSVGKTEEQLTAAKVPYEVGKAQFKHLARAQIAQSEVGGLKLLFHTETKEILGIHCFGQNASEIVHIGQAIMQQKNGGNNIEYFVNTTFNYPTMAEAYRVAALNGLNRLI
ncbi:Si-specific NAD(P)(+) transhydrogenase [Saccharobesus litoralis]|uniref:Soluble pyridine nucleotide transhydrogenase n=1 Tax=Saccharobesus litoralis TaxID=2172099 RepID=A0A2S0VSC4_9ALTE|nr:Si-specific NAD(P)(+) transhydrogenase [Saccharobesus litoralis]AWB67121.1 Si-specific NAD(P)(+) transhydrogenase [Saccharobesus litoralis]